MQTYVAEINGRAIFAFRSVDESCAQAWLDIHGLMRRTLERLQSGGKAIWDGQAEIIARKANPGESILWRQSSDRAAGEEQIDELDGITIWLIPIPQEPIIARTSRKQRAHKSQARPRS